MIADMKFTELRVLFHIPDGNICVRECSVGRSGDRYGHLTDRFSPVLTDFPVFVKKDGCPRAAGGVCAGETLRKKLQCAASGVEYRRRALCLEKRLVFRRRLFGDPSGFGKKLDAYRTGNGKEKDVSL